MAYAWYGSQRCAVCGRGRIGVFFNGTAHFGGVTAGDGFKDSVVAGEDEERDCGYVEGIRDGDYLFGVDRNPGGGRWCGCGVGEREGTEDDRHLRTWCCPWCMKADYLQS